MELITEWERKGRKEGLQRGREEGREEGELAIVLRLLVRRCGPLPVAVRKQINDLPLTRLEALAEALLDFADLNDLKRWLRGAAN